LLTGYGTKNDGPIYIGVSSYGLGNNAEKPIYTELSNIGTENNKPIHISVSNQGLGNNADKPIYTHISNIGTENAKPIYIRTSMPITEFTANIALQIYSWSNSMTTDGKQSIGNAKRAAQDAFVRAEEFVKQLMNEKYIDIKNGLVVWRTSNDRKKYVIF
jgi:hypothetical protein